MKIECVQEKLRSILQQAEKISSKNVNLPVLSCILIDVQKGQCSIQATNLDVGFKATLPVKVEEEGTVAVPAAVLSGFIANTGKEKSVKLETVGENLSVTTLKGKTLIKCVPHEDFPTVPELENGDVFEMVPSEVVRGLKAVSYSASISSIKPELASVYMYAEGSDLVFAATDSFRLAEKKIKTKSAKECKPVLIPIKNVGDIIRVLESTEGTVEVRVNKHQIAFMSEHVYIMSRVIDGTFPDYRQIIPKEFKTEATLLKEDLTQSLKIATVFSNTFNQVTLSINPAAKHFELTTKNNALGENTSDLDAALTGEVLEANFNYRYIADCLQSVESDSLSLLSAGPSRPLVIRGVSDKSFTYLVMPMNR